jgi:hypothetical protein
MCKKIIHNEETSDIISFIKKRFPYNRILYEKLLKDIGEYITSQENENEKIDVSELEIIINKPNNTNKISKEVGTSICSGTNHFQENQQCYDHDSIYNVLRKATCICYWCGNVKPKDDSKMKKIYPELEDLLILGRKIKSNAPPVAGFTLDMVPIDIKEQRELFLKKYNKLKPFLKSLGIDEVIPVTGNKNNDFAIAGSFSKDCHTINQVPCCGDCNSSKGDGDFSSKNKNLLSMPKDIRGAEFPFIDKKNIDCQRRFIEFKNLYGEFCVIKPDLYGKTLKKSFI